jgi:hypothetical protein
VRNSHMNGNLRRILSIALIILHHKFLMAGLNRIYFMTRRRFQSRIEHQRVRRILFLFQNMYALFTHQKEFFGDDHHEDMTCRTDFESLKQNGVEVNDTHT